MVHWSYVSHLSAARPTQAVFTTFMDEMGLTHIVFGDNSAGRIPPVNAEFFVSYRYGVGAEANDLPANSIKGIANIPNVDLIGVTVTNKASPVGGTDPESIDSMRFSISRGGNRLRSEPSPSTTTPTLAMQVPGVAKSVACGAVYTAVHVRVAPIDGKADANYMDRLLKSVDAYLQDKIMVGSRSTPSPPTSTSSGRTSTSTSSSTCRTPTTARRSGCRPSRWCASCWPSTWSTSVPGYRSASSTAPCSPCRASSTPTCSGSPPSAAGRRHRPRPGRHHTTVRAGRLPPRRQRRPRRSTPAAGTYRRNDATNPTAFAFSTTDAAERLSAVMSLKIGDHIIYSPVG